MPRTRYEPGPDRQRLNEILGEIARIAGLFCEHDPLVHGVTKLFRRRCGKPTCRCRKGSPHETLVLVDRSSGSRKVRKVSRPQQRALRGPTQAYRRLKRLRVRLGELHREVLKIGDRLCRFRLRAGEELLLRLRMR